MTNTERPNAWLFVEKHYPNYFSDSLITYAVDLQKIIEGEYEEGDSADEVFRLMKEEGLSPEHEYDSVHRIIYESAICNFLKQNKNE